MSDSTPIGDDFERIDQLCNRAIEHIGALSDFEADFVMSFVDRLDQYERRTLLSEKQRGVLDRIEKKLGGD